MFTAATIAIFLGYLLLTFVVFLLMIGFKYLLAYDTEHAPKFKWSNPLIGDGVGLNSFILWDGSPRIVEHGGKFFAVLNNGKAVSDSCHQSWPDWETEKSRRRWCTCHTKDEAIRRAEKYTKNNPLEVSVNWKNVRTAISLGLLLDIILFFGTINFMFTATAVGIVGLFIGVRTLAKFTYKGLAGKVDKEIKND